MDITTLAAAKAYTDKKVAEGGGSGGGGLPVVELATLPSPDGSVLTAEETAQVEAAMASKACVVVIWGEEFPFSIFVCFKVEFDGAATFFGQMLATDTDGAIVPYDFMMAVVDGAGLAQAYPKGS